MTTITHKNHLIPPVSTGAPTVGSSAQRDERAELFASAYEGPKAPIAGMELYILMSELESAPSDDRRADVVSTMLRDRRIESSDAVNVVAAFETCSGQSEALARIQPRLADLDHLEQMLAVIDDPEDGRWLLYSVKDEAVPTAEYAKLERETQQLENTADRARSLGMKGVGATLLAGAAAGISFFTSGLAIALIPAGLGIASAFGVTLSDRAHNQACVQARENRKQMSQMRIDHWGWQPRPISGA